MRTPSAIRVGFGRDAGNARPGTSPGTRDARRRTGRRGFAVEGNPGRTMTGPRPGGWHGVGRGMVEVSCQWWGPEQLPREATSRLPGLWEARSAIAGREAGRLPDAPVLLVRGDC